ncbi:AraC family transcriptional regulator [Streptomyces cellulosae]|uniref:AraC family transcriptional regulator n=1 Tax=Streptomyces cellulosae TaxID=1968 RepID=UPI001F3EFAF8|nr:AraC family transcriptional regulator [Streptomyces cellulosae]
MEDPMTLTSTDPLADLLNGVRTRGAVFNQSTVFGPWAARFEDGSPLALAVPLRGSLWVMPQDADPARLGPGDVAVLCGGTPYVIADDPATEPDVVIRSGGRCTTVRGEESVAARTADAPPSGTAEPGSTLLLSGLHPADHGVPSRLLAALPPLAVVEAELGTCPVSSAVFEEITREEPGQQILLDRTLDLMLITALRAWLTRPGAQIPAWYQAHGDPVVGPVLRLLQADPARPWTLPALAAEAGVSRANLARRFTALVGRPPMTYLRERRLALAADLLREPDATLARVADRVGFSNAFALSAAFKREHGVSPNAYRIREPRVKT